MQTSDGSIVRRIHEEAESRGDLAVIDECYAPQFRDERHPERGAGPAGIKQHIERLRLAFPDLEVTVEDLIAEGNLVAVRVTSRGTHQGAFAGIDPTGRRVAWTGIVIRKIADGQVVEQWAQYDTVGLLEQLRAPPSS
jgi:predicted ester cyclase